jgi:hypothetical protein
MAFEPFEEPKSSDNKDDFCFDTLCALVERGPVWDGNIPSKYERNVLIERGYAVRVINNGEEGFTAATPLGMQLYINHVGGKTLQEAIIRRKTHSVILKAKQG